MIRILHIGMSYNCGGIENFVMNYYRGINKKKIQFDFVNPYTQPLAFEKDIIELGGKIYQIPDFHKHLLSYRKELLNIIRLYSIVHVHMLSAANLIPLEIASQKGVQKIIAHAHSTNTEGKLRPMLHRVNYRKIKKLATHFFACSDKAGKWMFGKNTDFQVIRNAVSLKRFSFSEEKRDKVREKLCVNEKTVLYGNVGCMNASKNQLFLLKIFSEILKRQSNSCLCIVGTGELYNEIVKLSEELHIDGNVLLLGKRMDVDEIYNAFDYMILPSVYEGFPITLVEAQANGLKCYVSQGNVPEEVKIIETLEFISLEKTPCEWAEIILSGSRTRFYNAPNILKKHHYDINSEIKCLEKIYVEK